MQVRTGPIRLLVLRHGNVLHLSLTFFSFLTCAITSVFSFLLHALSAFSFSLFFKVYLTL